MDLIGVHLFSSTSLKEGLTNKNQKRDTDVIFIGKDVIFIGKDVILVGDSMLNNSDYIYLESDEKDNSVSGLIKQLSSNNINVHNYAKNHATIDDCYSQIDHISLTRGENIVISAGGNNIMNEYKKYGSINNTFVSSLFQKYCEMVLLVKDKCSTNNSTIYLLNLYKPTRSKFTKLYPIIDQWNTLIQDFAKKNDFKIIPTNKLLTLDSDFVYDYEPSKTGGQKIASAILQEVSI